MPFSTFSTSLSLSFVLYIGWSSIPSQSLPLAFSVESFFLESFGFGFESFLSDSHTQALGFLFFIPSSL